MDGNETIRMITKVGENSKKVHVISRYEGAVALTVGSAPRSIVPELRHFHWLLKMNYQLN